MTKTEFIRDFAREYEISLAESKTICESVFAHLRKCIEENDAVMLPKFGTFKKIVRKERAVRHPVTKAMTTVPEHVVISFKPSSYAIADGDDDSEDEEE